MKQLGLLHTMQRYMQLLQKYHRKCWSIEAENRGFSTILMKKPIGTRQAVSKIFLFGFDMSLSNAVIEPEDWGQRPPSIWKYSFVFCWVNIANMFFPILGEEKGELNWSKSSLNCSGPVYKNWAPVCHVQIRLRSNKFDISPGLSCDCFYSEGRILSKALEPVMSSKKNKLSYISSACC